MLPTDTDSELLRAFSKEGSERAFAVLVERYAGLVYHVARRRSGSTTLAEEAAQNAFAILARKAGSVAGERLPAWLHRTAFLEAARLYDQERRRLIRMKKFADDPTSKPSQVLADHPQAKSEEVVIKIEASLNRLSEPDRQVLILRFYQGLGFEEISRRHGGLAATWRKRSERALERLRHRLATTGVAMPVATLTAGLSALATPQAPAALVSTLTSKAVTPITLNIHLYHLLHAMTIKQLTAATGIALLLLVPLSYQAAQVQQRANAVAALETRVETLKSSVLPPSAPVTTLTEQRKPKRDEGINLAEWAAALAEANRGDLTKALPIMRQINDLDGATLSELVLATEREALTDDQRAVLYKTLLLHLTSHDPKLAAAETLRLASNIPVDEMPSFVNVLSKSMEKWGASDPSAAEAWFDEQNANGAFEDRQLSRSSDSPRLLAGALFKGLMKGDPERAQSFFTRLDSATQTTTLRVAGQSARSIDDVTPLLPFFRTLSDADRFEAAKGSVLALSRTGGLYAMSEFVSLCELSPALTTQALVYGAGQGAARGMSESEMVERTEWLRLNLPDADVDLGVGKMLGLAAMRKPELVRSLIEDEWNKHPSDELIASFVRASVTRPNQISEIIPLTDRITDPTAREETLAGLVERWSPEIFRRQAQAAGMTAERIDAVTNRAVTP
ncbi:MAG: sigma-70 family RNA polymerase sigma factor [Verrucomicrobiae bacterium]|nr:sigma-70 family RNA polymerase sigma factor [Verrucomicrobiae bacterium]